MSGRHGKMKSRKGKMKASHGGGKGQGRIKCRDRVGVHSETSGHNAWARAKATVEGRPTIGKVRGHDEGRER